MEDAEAAEEDEEAEDGAEVRLMEVFVAAGTAERLVAEGPEERARAELGARDSPATVVADARPWESTGNSGEGGSTVCRFKAERSSSMAKRDD